MRPGSCVGPQQHFLYDNQLEWVRWAAQDELRRELASQNGLAGRALAAAATTAAAVGAGSSGSSSSAAARPITPPNEADLAAARARSTTPGRGGGAGADGGGVPPVTPRRPPPGQPRKTPGRSRHAVAEPETAPPDSGGGVAGKSVAEREEERMEGVVMSSPRKARTSTSAAKDVKGKGPMLNGDAENEGDDDDEEEEDPLALISPKKLDLGVASTRPKTPSASTRPTRIARPARPLSALADNRIVDRIGSTSSSITRSSTRAGSAAAAATNALGMARSKAAKDLNVVLETHATGTITTAGTGAAGAQGRYSLRNGRTTSANGTVTTAHPSNNSPTKLPQPPNRVLGKRDAVATRPTSASSSSSATTPPADLGPGFDPAAVVAATSGGKIVGGRNVRRRRSSMGGHETVNAG